MYWKKVWLVLKHDMVVYGQRMKTMPAAYWQSLQLNFVSGLSLWLYPLVGLFLPFKVFVNSFIIAKAIIASEKKLEESTLTVVK